jgi:hypothetical protein
MQEGSGQKNKEESLKELLKRFTMVEVDKGPWRRRFIIYDNKKNQTLLITKSRQFCKEKLIYYIQTAND